MALVVKDRVKQTTTTSGTGSIVLNGAVDGFQTFTTALTDGDTTYYAIVEPSTNSWEVGLGTWNEGTTTLARTTVLASSNSNNAISLSGQAEVFITQPASKATYLNADGDLSITNDLSVGGTFTVTGATTLQDSVTVQGNLTVQGTTTTVEATNLAIADNMIYLNDGSTVSNPDLGWAGNYNDGTYAHAGVFRDASDGTFKFFDSYTPEPDASTNIDTAHASFNLAKVATGNLAVTGNITVSSTVDGRDIAADGTKLDGIEAGATADQTASEILTAIKTVDGAASGLDADLLDGQDGSYYLDWTHVTNKPDPTVTLSGDVSGSATMTDLGSITITTTVANDSHTHDGRYYTETEVGNFFDGTTAITGYNKTNWDTAYGWGNHASAGYLLSSSYTAADVLTKIKTVDGAASGLDADLLDGQDSSYYLDWTNTTNKPDPVITLTGAVTGSGTMTDLGSVSITTTATSDPTLTLAGDATGSATFTNLGNATLTVTVVDDSHNHIISNVDGLQTALDGKLSTSGKAADSDLLDGLDSTAFARYSAGGTLSNALADAAWVVSNSGTTNIDHIWHDDGANAWNFNSDSSFKATANSRINAGSFYANGNVVWNAGNDGSGSGLDADLLDGIDSKDYSRKVMETASGSASDGNYWAKIATYTITGNYNDGTFLYFFMNEESSTQSSAAIVAVTVRTNNVSTGQANSVAVSILGMHGTDPFNDNAFKVLDNGSGTAIELWVQKNSNYDHISVYEHSAHMENVSVAYNNNAAWQASEPVGTGNNVRSAGLEYRDNTVWHQGNDGSGSGLDADLLDGQQGSYYLDWTNTTNKPDPVITLTGAVTGSGTMTDLGNVSITTTATSDPTLTLAGDATGSATFTNLGNATLTVTVVDDSHNHIISNVDGLQTALDAKLASSSYTASDVLSKILTVDGSGSSLDADTTDGYHVSTTRNAANTIPVRDGNGYLQLGWINTTSGATTSTINKIYASTDDYIRYVTPATLISQLGLWTSGNDGSGSGLDADLWDGNQFSTYLNQAVLTTSSPTFANVYVGDYVYHTGDTDTYTQFHAADQWRVVTGGTERFEINNSDVTVQSALKEKYVALSGTTPSIDVDAGGAFSLTTSGNTTFTFTAFTSGISGGFILQLTSGGSHTITWPASVDWAGGTAPDAPASGETDIYVFWSRDGGTTWYGVQSIDAAA